MRYIGIIIKQYKNSKTRLINIKNTLLVVTTKKMLTKSKITVYNTVTNIIGTKYPTFIESENILQKIKNANAANPITSKVIAEAKFANVSILTTAKRTYRIITI
jgi:hypothetical protein